MNLAADLVEFVVTSTSIPLLQNSIFTKAQKKNNEKLHYFPMNLETVKLKGTLICYDI